MPLIRSGLVVTALIMCAWFALAIRQAQDTTEATAIITRGAPSAAQAARVAQLLNSAATLNPDRQVDVLRGELAIQRGQDAHARQILFEVIRAQPKFLQAWVAYSEASLHDPIAYIAAQIGIRRLVPTLVRPH